MAKLECREKSKERNGVAKKAWDTRIRKEGVEQIAKAFATLASRD